MQCNNDWHWTNDISQIRNIIKYWHLIRPNIKTRTGKEKRTFLFVCDKSEPADSIRKGQRELGDGFPPSSPFILFFHLLTVTVMLFRTFDSVEMGDGARRDRRPFAEVAGHLKTYCRRK